MVHEYTYTRETSRDTEEVANTRIFEDGTILTNTLVADDGYFGGEINAHGRFRGTLENVGGTIKGATIDANLINGNILIRNNDSIKAKNNGQLYFNVSKEPLSSKETTEHWDIDKFSWERQNSNGENAGKWFSKESTIAYVPFASGATITIPQLYGSIYRYAADGKQNNKSYLWVKCNAYYNYGSLAGETLIDEVISAKTHTGQSTQSIPFSTSTITFTAKADGTLSMTFGYDVHLSTYSWLGGDKSSVKIKFNTAGSQIAVAYDKPTTGVLIAPNGMRVLSVSGASVTILDNEITLLSPESNYGLRITDSGVEIRRKGEWSKL